MKDCSYMSSIQLFFSGRFFGKDSDQNYCAISQSSAYPTVMMTSRPMALLNVLFLSCPIFFVSMHLLKNDLI